MRLNKIEKLRVNSFEMKVVWEPKHGVASFSYVDRKMEIGTQMKDPDYILMLLCHELWEIAAIEVGVRLSRPDVDSDYIFVYDHRQHDLMANMVAGWLTQFIK